VPLHGLKDGLPIVKGFGNSVTRNTVPTERRSYREKQEPRTIGELILQNQRRGIEFKTWGEAACWSRDPSEEIVYLGKGCNNCRHQRTSKTKKSGRRNQIKEEGKL